MKPMIEMVINFLLTDLSRSSLIITYRKYRMKNTITSLEERRNRNNKKNKIRKRWIDRLKIISFFVIASSKCKRAIKTRIEN